jgi:integrase/recombinase XerD
MMNSRFEQFCKERLYLKNVSPRTIEWHQQSLKWLAIEQPTADDLKALVLRMREAGLKASSVNCRLRSINAYLKWSGSSLKVPRLKESVLVLPTFKVEDIKKIASWKPRTFYERRTQALMLTLADTGTRLNEVLSLKWNQVDFDNLLITVTGKGDKQRKIPFSFELRKVLWKLAQSTTATQTHITSRQSPMGTNSVSNAVPTSMPLSLLFQTRQNKKLSHRNTLRDVKRTLKRLRIELPERTIHAFRHTFAIEYLRRGGSVFHLQKVLGHSSLAMTLKYANLLTGDLQAVHQKISLLA